MDLHLHSVHFLVIILTWVAGTDGYCFSGSPSLTCISLKSDVYVFTHCSLSAVTHAPFHASVLRPASQVGPMHEAAWMREVS